MKALFPYITELYRSSRIRLSFNILLMVVLGMLEGMGILLIVPLLMLAGVIPGLQATGGTGLWVKHFFQSTGMPLNLPVVLVLYTGINVGQAWLKRYQSVLSEDIQESFSCSLSVRLFRAVANARWELLISRSKSDITNVLITELTRVYLGMHYLLEMAASGLISLVQIILAFMVAPGLTTLIMGGGSILFLLLQPFLKDVRRVGEDVSRYNRDLLFDLTEHLNGLKEVKTYAIETGQIESFAKIRNMLKQNAIRFTMIQSRTAMLYSVGTAVFISLFLFGAIGIFRLNTQEFILIVYISARLWPRLSSLQKGLQNVTITMPAFRAAKELEDRCLAAGEEMPADGAGTRMELTCGVEFRHVSFVYDGYRSHYAVKDAAFFLPSGSTSAFVGVSGAGKSTLVDLLTGLLVPTTGDILVDGRPLMAGNLRAWRNSIGYVPQDPFLFNATIRDNLLWACPEASEERIWEAVRSASVESFIRSLPEGLDTVVGDRGVCISGGERQRIVLARALIRKPSVLILDEATSSLDSKNENRIKCAIEGLRGKLTIVVIAHRISTIRSADRIFVLDDGRIVEQGSYQSLMKDTNSRFYSLAC